LRREIRIFDNHEVILTVPVEISVIFTMAIPNYTSNWSERLATDPSIPMKINHINA